MLEVLKSSKSSNVVQMPCESAVSLWRRVESYRLKSDVLEYQADIGWSCDS